MRTGLRSGSAAVAAIGALVAIGCGGDGGGEGPEDSVRALYDALAAGDGERACGELTERGQAEVTKATGDSSCAEALTAADRSEFEDAEVQEVDTSGETGTATVRTGSSTKRLALRKVGDEWKVEGLVGVVGGLFDLFEGDGQEAGDPSVQRRIDAAEERLETNPDDRAALVQLVRGHYTLASTGVDRESGAFSEAGKQELAKASAAWKRYLASDPAKPDASIATIMLTAYSPLGLNEPDSAAQAAEIVALARSDVASYVQLVQYATLAGQERKADLAAAKALELAPKAERDTVKELIEAARAK